MIKIIYPKNNRLDKFHAEFKDCFDLGDLKKKYTNFLADTPAFSQQISESIEDILLLPIEKLAGIAKKIDNIIPSLNKEQKETLKQIFNYAHIPSKKIETTVTGNKTQYDENIAKFFMNWSEELNLVSCYYCNIDFINAFKYNPKREKYLDEDYNDALDFVKKIKEKELEDIPEIGPKIAARIKEYLEDNPDIVSIDDLKISETGKNTYIENIKTYFKEIKKIIELQRNHFTLDHFIDKAEYPIFALSIYNLIPSCSPCNSKFKHSKDLYSGDIANSYELSPSYKDFRFNEEVNFPLLFDPKGKIRYSQRKGANSAFEY